MHLHRQGLESQSEENEMNGVLGHPCAHIG